MDVGTTLTDERERATRLGKRIKNRRRDLGITQVQLAEIIGTTQSAVCKWELGYRLPSIANVARLKRGLALSDSDFQSWIDLVA